MNTALVVGGNAIAGRNLTQYLESTGRWKIIVTSQSPLQFDTRATFVKMDLLDEKAVQQKAETLKEVTHIFFAAYIERKELLEQTAINSALLENLVKGMEAVAPGLQRPARCLL